MSESQPPRRLIILGATGSIGTSTLEVVAHLARCGGPRFDVVGLAAGNSAEALREAAVQFSVSNIAIADASQADALRDISRVFAGKDAAVELIESVARPGDLVVGAMVGSAGLPATLAAIDRGCDIALANKETLVAAGSVVMPRAAAMGVKILPVDSEHSALFQCLEALPLADDRTPIQRDLSAVRRLVITASGGPFRTWAKQQISSATVKEALNHPTWNMGPKVTIDSASLMNKALEVIEAHWLFGLAPEKIETIIHPQSIVHSFVEFVDGSVLAQLGAPDMKTPIQYALTWPHRSEASAPAMDWTNLRSLDFEPVDHDRFGAVKLAYGVIQRGGTAGAIFNAANEVAVAAFLDGLIPFGDITSLTAEALDTIVIEPVKDLADVMRADAAARTFVLNQVDQAANRSGTPRRNVGPCDTPKVHLGHARG